MHDTLTLFDTVWAHVLLHFGPVFAIEQNTFYEESYVALVPASMVSEQDLLCQCLDFSVWSRLTRFDISVFKDCSSIIKVLLACLGLLCAWVGGLDLFWVLARGSLTLWGLVGSDKVIKQLRRECWSWPQIFELRVLFCGRVTDCRLDMKRNIEWHAVYFDFWAYFWCENLLLRDERAFFLLRFSLWFEKLRENVIVAESLRLFLWSGLYSL